MKTSRSNRFLANAKSTLAKAIIVFAMLPVLLVAGILLAPEDTSSNKDKEIS